MCVFARYASLVSQLCWTHFPAASQITDPPCVIYKKINTDSPTNRSLFWTTS